MRWLPLQWVLLLALFCTFVRGMAAEVALDTVQAGVTYVSSSDLYIDAGGANRIELGNQGEVFHNGTMVAHIEVVFAADHSSSCRVVGKMQSIQIGDSVRIFVVAITAPPPVDTLQVAATIAPRIEARPVLKQAPRNVLSARVAIQSYMLHDRTANGHDYVQPTVVMNGAIRNIGGTHLSLMLRARSRQQDLPQLTDGGTQTRWDHHVYEMAMVYDNPTSPVYLSVGRLRAGEINGMGEVDGLLFTYGQKHGLRTGFFYGTQPDPRTSSAKSDLVKGGALAVYETGSGAHQFSSTVALSGEYYHGSVSREFAYVQTNWTMNHTLAFYQNAEVNVYRGWRCRTEGKTFELTNVLLNAMCSPWKRLTTTFSYDASTNYRTYETRLLPDSLFDTQLWQGERIAADLQLPLGMTMGISGGLRRRTGDPETMRNGSLALTLNNPWGSQLMLSARANAFTNASTSGQQPSIGISRSLFSRWLVDLQVGQDRYDFQSENRALKSNWLHASTDYDISRFLYVSTYAEFYRGGGQDTDRYLLEFGIRH
jgi:hypothetical protein